MTSSPGTGTANAEAIEAWDGPLFDRFFRYREIFTTGLGVHGETALALYPPQAGQRVLDIGCGFGDTTQRIAELVGPEGHATGVDAAPRFIELAREEFPAPNADYEVRDVQVDDLGGPYDHAFSRMGTMFFANPVAALRNVRSSLVPGARLVMVVWRDRVDNDWVYRAQQITEQILERPEEYDDPTCGPGPFSMANANTTTDVLKHAGYEDIALHRSDEPMLIGRDLDEALDVTLALGPAAEILRLWGDRKTHLHEEVRAAVREGLEEFSGPDGVRASASCWIASGVVPAA